jgi:hypothetical protein
MSLYLSVRSQSVGGPVVDPFVVQGDGTADPPTMHLLDWATVESMVAGKNVLFGVHGFNVSLRHGACSLGQLEPFLALTASDLFFGVLWPGDFWLPVVNYPFEGSDAMDSGRRIAAVCRQSFARAQSISFVSHSLGARVVLEAVKNLDRPARVVCLTAAAINRDCLDTEYAGAAANASAIAILASRKDLVLKVAFQVGDPIADLLHEDHTLFEPALGAKGPPVPALPPILSPWQIPDAADFGHGDYLPPGDHLQNAQAANQARWSRAAGFMARAFHEQPQTWP